MRCVVATGMLLSLFIAPPLTADDANRYVYLDEFLDPYYVHTNFPKLITPQWVGEEGVDAVVVLAIDDMRDVDKYEAYLRPILDRLKQIDGRAPVSIMTNRVDPWHPHLQRWQAEGVSLEIHTYDHPCPCLQGGDLQQARTTYHRCVDLVAEVPGSRPVAFRMPCCDSRNTPSPRFWTEIFNQTSTAGNFLEIDSSVFQLFTSDDSDLPTDLVRGEAGDERFRRYLPFPSFVNTIENYPYPYVIGRLCWQFPCMVPSDWEAQHVQQPNNPDTVRDMKLALDATVIKKGVFNLVFHPHGWIRNDQVVELIDHAVATYGSRVKFLNFREASQRINEHLLRGEPLRDARGRDNGVRILDLDADGYLDAVIANNNTQLTRRWDPQSQTWDESRFPVRLVDESGGEFGVRFGVVGGQTVALTANPQRRTAWRYTGGKWTPDDQLIDGLNIDGKPILTAIDGRDQGVRLRDIDGDGCCELIAGGAETLAVFAWRDDGRWQRLPFSFPESLVDNSGADAGTRFADVDANGRDDVIFSDERRYAVHLFESAATGWSRKATRGPRSDGIIPMIVREGTNNGAWFHSDHLWIQNEDTNRLPDGVDRIAMATLARAAEPAVPPAAEPMQVGAARHDITPDYAVRLSGYGNRTAESAGVAQRIYARAIAIGSDHGTGPAILVGVENCAVPGAMVESLAEELNQRIGLPRERLVVCSTHTHTAPWLVGSLPFMFPPIPDAHQKNVARYTAELRAKLLDVIREALANRREAELSWGQGNVTFAANRRVVQTGQWTGFGEQPGGPVDHSLPILVARDSQQRLIAVIANYACHCTTLGGDFNQIAGDWAGYAQQYLEQQHEGVVAAVVIGCGADANPKPRGTLDVCRQQGRALADEVTRLLGTHLTPLDQPLECRLARIDLPFAAPPSKEHLQQQLSRGGSPAHHARHYLDRIQRGESLPRAVDYPVAAWNFGHDLAMVFLGGEVVVDYVIRLKAELDAERLWVTAYSNDVPSYIPSRRILREGGYEADTSMIYYAQPTRYAPEVEQLIIDTVQKLVPPEFYSADTQVGFPPAKSPAAALKTMSTLDGMVVELVAAEPLVVDPVAFDWGPDGRLWVVEMRDYPNGMDGQGLPGGRVRLLSDTDGDGRYDRSTVFLDDIPFPTGVKVWRDGILVTAAPLIFYAEDTTGDGRADVRQALYDGFGEGNQQHRVNGLRWGLDNWLYVGNGDSGGMIRSKLSDVSVDVRGRDMRIRPDSGDLETQSGQTQFGRTRDDWGSWFGGNNSNPIWHYVLEDHYLRRNPHLAAPDVKRQISEQPGAAPVFPTSRTLARFNDFDRVNRFTSACSPIIYRDQWLGAEFGGNMFVCEPVHNLVHRELVEPNGVTFKTRRAANERQSEFLASTDNWFRPSMVRTGPDGALWVSDMYRFVIEHPKWIPAEWQRKLDVRAGDGRGRIYRIYPAAKGPRKIPQLDAMGATELVAALGHDNGWVRDTAQQMLLWRNETGSQDALVAMVRSGATALARLHALCTLDGLGLATPRTVVLAMEDEHPGVRRNAIRIAESMLDDNRTLADRVAAMARDPDAMVRMQLAYSLGETAHPVAGPALAHVALASPDDPYVTAAVLSSVRQENLESLVSELLADSDPPPRAVLAQLLAIAGATNDRRMIDRLVSGALEGDGAGRLAILAEIIESLRKKNRQPLSLLDGQVRQQVVDVLQLARRRVADAGASVAERTMAIQLVGHEPERRDEDGALLGGLLVPASPPGIQSAAVTALGRIESPETVSRLLAGWPAHTPALRREILDVIFRRAAWTRQWLQAMDQGQIPAAKLDARHRQQLAQHRDESVRRLAEKLLANDTESDRASVVGQFASVASLGADITRGKEIFAKRCGNCHQLQGVGHALGPDLTALTDKSPQSLLVAMLDPNRAVEDRFIDYGVLLDDGRQFNGVITAETSTSITLAAPDAKQHVILRNEIDLLEATGKSFMPEGLEKDMPAQEMADVIAYVRQIGPPRKEFPGNEPRAARVRDDGSIRLLAMDSRIYGPSLIFENQYRNLGYWHSPLDYATWTLHVPKDGTYRVSLEYACHDQTAGNSFLLSAAGKTLGGRVDGSGTWDDYRTQSIGSLQLPAGQWDVVFRSDGPLRGALMDLRTIRLIPEES